MVFLRASAAALQDGEHQAGWLEAPGEGGWTGILGRLTESTELSFPYKVTGHAHPHGGEWEGAHGPRLGVHCGQAHLLPALPDRLKGSCSY